MRTFRFCLTFLACCGFLTPAVQGGVRFSFHGMQAGQRVEDALLAHGLALAGADVDVQSTYGLTPLHRATNAEMVAALLDCGANAYALTLAGRSALHYAPDVASLELLVAAGLDVKQKDAFGESALFYAKDAACAAWLIGKMKEAGENPRLFLNEHSKRGRTVLHALCQGRASVCKEEWTPGLDAWLECLPDLTAEETAAYRARLDDFTLEAMLRVLLEAGADVNARGKHGRTVAFFVKHREPLELLKAYGADFTLTDAEGNTLLIPYDIGEGEKSVDAMRFLIAEGVDVNHFADDGRSALAGYNYWYDPEPTQLLLEAGADPNLAVREGADEWIPLLDTYCLESVRLLIAAGADVNARDSSGTPILCRIRDYSDIMRLMIEAGADVNAQTPDGSTALFSSNRGPETTKLLLETGADVNVRTISGNTPLFSAAEKPEVVKILIEAGVDVNAKGYHGRTALFWAVKDFKSLELFLQAGADVNVRNDDGETALYANVSSLDRWTFEMLMEAGAELDGPPGKPTLLHKAAENYRGYDHWLTKALIDAGLDVNAEDADGQTPLFTCHLLEMPVLIAAGADVNAKDFSGKTALHHTIRDWGGMFSSDDGDMKSAVLLTAGADPNIADNEGQTAIFACAYLREAEEALELLLKHGAKIDVVDNDLQTPLHCHANNLSAAKLLVERGANPNAMDANEQTPLFCVRNREAYLFLLEAGADPYLRNKNGELANAVLTFGYDGKKPEEKEPEDFEDFWDEDDDSYDELDELEELEESDSRPMTAEKAMKNYVRGVMREHGVTRWDEDEYEDYEYDDNEGFGIDDEDDDEEDDGQDCLGLGFGDEDDDETVF